ncbi:MAG: MFS transporter [Labedaea sp.]
MNQRAEPYPLRSVLAIPGVPRLLIAYFLSRMPSSMGPLALILLIQQETGSYGLAGVVTGVFGFGQALASPLQGRIIDRYGQTSLLVWGAVVFAAGFVAVVVSTLNGWNSVINVGASLVAGFAYPPVASCMRVMWPRLVPRELVASAYTLEATVQEGVFVSGPVFTSILVTIHSPAAAVITSAVCGLAGSFLFATSPVSHGWHERGSQSPASGPLRSAGVRTVMTTMVLVAAAIGLLQVAVASFAADHGVVALSGWLLGIWTAGSLAGGLIYGARDWSGSIGSRIVALLLIMAAVYGLLAFIHSVPAFGILIVGAGLPLAAWTSCSYVLIDRLALPGTEAEAFGWMATAFLAGLFAGSATAGFLVDSYGVQQTLFSASACLLTAGVLTAFRVHTLSTPDRK